uniref:Uncharacterized protein n=1 Tax=Oryza barthii TaxID=65489 RepID=A0A0D3HH29_9ORYZ
MNLIFLAMSYTDCFCRESFNENWIKLSWGGHQGGSFQPILTAGLGRDTVKGITVGDSRKEGAEVEEGWRPVGLRQDHFQATFPQYCSNLESVLRVTSVLAQEEIIMRRMLREVVTPAASEIQNQRRLWKLARGILLLGAASRRPQPQPQPQGRL